MWGNNYYNRQQSYGPGDAVAQILGAIMQRNAERKNNDAYMAIMDTGNKILNMKYNPASPEQQPGLFNTNPDITKPLTPDTSQQQSQGFFNMQPDVTKPMQTNNSMLTQPINEANMPIAKPQVTQQPAVPKTPTLQDQISFYKQQIPRKMKELVGKYGKEHAKEIYQHLTQTVNDKIAQVTDDYNRQQQEQAYQILGSNADYRTKLVAGMKAGLKPEMMKMALDNGLEFKFQDQGGKIGVYGVNNQTGTIVDMTTGQPITSDTMSVTMNPYQQGQLALGAERNAISREGNAIRAAGVVARGSGGRGSGGLTAAQQRSAGKDLSNARAIMNAYNPNGKPFINKDGETEWKPYTPAEQIQFNKAAEYIQANDPTFGEDQEQPQSQQAAEANPGGADWYYQTADAIKAKNPDATDEEIEAFMTKIINGG